MHLWRMKPTMGIVMVAVGLAACAPMPPNPPASDAELGPEPVPAAAVPELAALPEPSPKLHDAQAISSGGHLHGSPVMLKVAHNAGPQRERPEIVPGNRPSREESRRWMRRETLESPRVRKALGERYALLNSGWMDDEKNGAASPDRYQLVFYSYTRNEVVTVVTSGGREPISLESMTPQAQPAESREEVDAAVDIVRRDDRYARLVAHLHGRGILTPAPGRERHLYLLFYDAPRSTPARFQATVNMTTGKVIEAAPLR